MTELYLPRLLTLLLTALLLSIATPSSAALGVCTATPGADGDESIGGNINTSYYAAGIGSPAAGSTHITLASGSSNFKTNDLVLIIQMQGAEINTSNNNRYGADNGTGRGQIINASFLAGKYEFVSIASSSNTTLNLATPLHNSYQTNPGYRWQAIRIAQYRNLTLTSTLTAPAWNGRTGGVLVLDIANTLNFNGHSIDMSAKGFRGGGGYNHTGSRNQSNTDYVSTHSTSRTGAHASKGEGIAGTPYWIYDGTARANTTNTYTNGSYARGAPGNAGGGGTDGNPRANDQNSGGGGGGNGGAGAQGGNSWSSNLPTGGIGGAAFPAQPSRLAMGGGGGAGTVNNNTSGNTHGGVGGGIVIIRANRVEGSGTINVNGGNGSEPVRDSNDGSGGGGAGGSVLLLANQQSGSIQINARGGNGANNSKTPAGAAGGEHGPGGGGGGGVVFHSNALFPQLDLTQGASGRTGSTDQYYGAASSGGMAGNTVTGITPGDIIGTPPSFSCLEKQADISIEKRRSSGSMQGGRPVSFEIIVQNHGPDPTTAPLLVTDNLDSRLENISTEGENWHCDVINNNVECHYHPTLTKNETAPPLTIHANVKAQAVRSQFSNTASVMFNNDNASVMNSDPNTTNNTDTWNDIIYGVAEAGNKWLYLSNLTQSNRTLSRTVPTNLATHTFNNSTEQNFTLSPSLSSELVTNGQITARLCLEKGGGNSMRSVQVDLFHNNQQIGTSQVENFANSGWHLYIFPIEVDSNHIFNEGSTLRLQVRRSQQQPYDFTLSNNATNSHCIGEGPSRLEVDTSTVINVDDVVIYNRASTGLAISHITAGETMYVRATVSDPFGHADINNNSTVEILADGSNHVIAGPFSASNVLRETGAIKEFEYPVQVPDDLPAGTYIARVRANEGTEGTISHYAAAPFVITENASLTVKKAVYDSNKALLNDGSLVDVGIHPGDSLIYALAITNESTTGHAHDVIVMDKLPQFTEFLLDSIVFHDGVGNAEKTEMTNYVVEYSANNGSSWDYVPLSGAGKANSGYDANITHFRLRFPGDIMPPQSGFSVEYQIKLR